MLGRLLVLVTALVLSIGARAYAPERMRTYPGETVSIAKSAYRGSAATAESVSSEKSNANDCRVGEIWHPPMSLASSVRYTGYYSDAESGFNYAQQRYQLPGVGRFLQSDPWEGDTQRPITLNKYVYANGSPVIHIDPTGKYAEAGHYYTTYYIALKVGYGPDQARKLAFYSQISDEADELDAIGVQSDYLWGWVQTFGVLPSPLGSLEERATDRDFVQRDLHALTGGLGGIEAERTLKAIQGAGQDDLVTGLLIHRLADTYAHRRIDVRDVDGPLYETGAGHFDDTFWYENNPDLIQNHPDRYLAYVESLTTSLAQRRGLSPDEAARLASEVRDELTAVANVPRIKPGTGEYMSIDPLIAREFGLDEVAGVPPEYRTDKELESLSIQELRDLIEKEGGENVLVPERYPQGLAEDLLYFSIYGIDNSIEDALEAAGEERDMANRVRRDAVRAAILLDKVRTEEASEALIVRESPSGDGIER